MHEIKHISFVHMLFLHCKQWIATEEPQPGQVFHKREMNPTEPTTPTINKWMFPKSQVPPVIIHCNGMFHYLHHHFWGTPIAMETPQLQLLERNTVHHHGVSPNHCLIGWARGALPRGGHHRESKHG